MCSMLWAMVDCGEDGVGGFERQYKMRVLP
jgi:hypothetical protein